MNHTTFYIIPEFNQYREVKRIFPNINKLIDRMILYNIFY